MDEIQEGAYVLSVLIYKIRIFKKIVFHKQKKSLMFSKVTKAYKFRI
jgi:hypothetical protein